MAKMSKIGKWKCHFMKKSGKSTHVPEDAKFKTWRSVQRLNAVPAKSGHAQYSQEAYLNFRSRSTSKASSNLKVPNICSKIKRLHLQQTSRSDLGIWLVVFLSTFSAGYTSAILSDPVLRISSCLFHARKEFWEIQPYREHRTPKLSIS